MSIPLPALNVASAAIGQVFQLNLQNVGIGAGAVSANPAFTQRPARLYLFNDSGCGFSGTFGQSALGFNLPAGAWIPIDMPLGEALLNLQVLYILPTPPVSLVLATYYSPGEPLPMIATLGNSPVGIGGTVNTNFSSLSNEGNAANTLVIDIGTVTIAQLWQIFTDHFLISVQQTGVAHQVLKGQTAGNPLQLGQSGDTAEFLGNILFDGTFTAGANDEWILPYPVAQSLANNSTITLPTGVTKTVTDVAAITGIIMTAGTSAGQFFFLINDGTNGLTFAAAGSNVRGGSNVILSSGRGCGMIWNGSAWLSIGAN